MTQDRIIVSIDGIDELQRRFQLAEAELEKAFRTGIRRAVGAGRSRVFRQLKAITGEPRPFWVGRQRVFGGQDRSSGAARVWVGLNPVVRTGKNRRRVERQLDDGLAEQFDPVAVQDAMIAVFDAEIEKAAAKIVRQ